MNVVSQHSARLRKFLTAQWFNLALLGVFGVALIYPQWGAETGPLVPPITRSVAIATIFFVTGLNLPLTQMGAALGNVRLHLFCQSFSFILVPLLMLAFRGLAEPWFQAEIWQGMLVLAVMPTTITSCVVFTALAGGNVAGAVANGILGNLLGIVLSPLLFVLIVAQGAAVRFDWSQLGLIAGLIVLPLGLGLTLRRLVGHHLQRLLPWLPYIAGGALLVIMFFALASALAPGSPFWQWTSRDVALAVASLLLMHSLLLMLAWRLSAWVRLPELDRRAALFVASQKTIALGLPLIHFFYAFEPTLAGVVSIPLIIYHPMQLLVASAIVGRFR